MSHRKRKGRESEPQLESVEEVRKARSAAVETPLQKYEKAVRKVTKEEKVTTTNNERLDPRQDLPPSLQSISKNTNPIVASMWMRLAPHEWRYQQEQERDDDEVFAAEDVEDESKQEKKQETRRIAPIPAFRAHKFLCSAPKAKTTKDKEEKQALSDDDFRKALPSRLQEHLQNVRRLKEPVEEEEKQEKPTVREREEMHAAKLQREREEKEKKRVQMEMAAKEREMRKSALEAEEKQRREETQKKEEAKVRMRFPIDRASASWISIYRFACLHEKKAKIKNVCVIGGAGSGKTSHALTLAEVCQSTLRRKAVLLTGLGPIATNRLQFLVRSDQLPVYSFASLLAPLELLLGRGKNEGVWDFILGLGMVRECWVDAEVWIVDDLQCISAQEFALANHFARLVRNNSTECFGGLQLLAFADFAQYTGLFKEEEITTGLFRDVFGENVLTFDQNLRTDRAFYYCQNALRQGFAAPGGLADNFLRMHIQRLEGENTEQKQKIGNSVKLTIDKKDADQYNMEQQKQQQQARKVWERSCVLELFDVRGGPLCPFPPIDVECMCRELGDALLPGLSLGYSERVSLTVGAQVMLVCAQDGHAPGEIGHVVEFKQRKVVVYFPGMGTTSVIAPHHQTVDVMLHSVRVATLHWVQLPLILAWALPMNLLFGLRVPALNVNLEKVPACVLYTACSIVGSLRDVEIQGWAAPQQTCNIGFVIGPVHIINNQEEKKEE